MVAKYKGEGGERVIFDLENFEKFMEEEFYGNSTQAAKALNLNTSTLTRILSKKRAPGIKFLEAIVDYCRKNGIDYSNIIQI